MCGPTITRAFVQHLVSDFTWPSQNTNELHGVCSSWHSLPVVGLKMHTFCSQAPGCQVWELTLQGNRNVVRSVLPPLLNAGLLSLFSSVHAHIRPPWTDAWHDLAAGECGRAKGYPAALSSFHVHAGWLICSWAHTYTHTQPTSTHSHQKDFHSLSFFTSSFIFTGQQRMHTHRHVTHKHVFGHWFSGAFHFNLIPRPFKYTLNMISNLALILIITPNLILNNKMSSRSESVPTTVHVPTSIAYQEHTK